ncbi:hypothetical protein N9872_01495 [Paraglaciecola sp.]|nr:hypothetical protein [Paraglaciecola sp.]MDB4281627.1 hypothetical protein [Paraglaciecola sp.]
MRYFKTVPQRGDFAYQCLVGPQKVSGAKIADLRDHFGLKLTKHMPFGSVRDEEGHIYCLVRALNAPGSTPNPTKFMYLNTRVDEQNIRLDLPKMEARATTMFPKRWLENDTAYWSNLDGDEGAGWQISASGERLTWEEQGLLKISGALLGEGFQWYLPGEDWGTFYVSQLYDVAGKCEGRKVKGIIALDQAWLAEGGAIHYKKDLVVNNKMHVIWWTFATIYKDGTWDTGSFMVGHDNLGYAIFQNEKGEVRCTTDIEGEVCHKDGSYFAESAYVVVDGEEKWEFLPDAHGEMIDFVGGFPITAQQEGRWRRVGDTREPDRWVAWGESDRRNGSARNVRGSDI